MDLAAFSRPDRDKSVRRRLLDELLPADAQARTKRFVHRNAAALGNAAGLAATLSRWAAMPASLAEIRGYPLALANYRRPDLDPVWVATMAALHLHAEGLDGEWRAGFARPMRLRWGGMISEPVSSATVLAEHGETELTLVAGDGRRSVLRLSAAAAGPFPAGWQALPLASLGGRRLTVFGRETAAAFPGLSDAEYSPEASCRAAATLGTIGALLQRYAPAYLAWVADVSLGVVAIRAPGEGLCASYSYSGMPGVAFVSFPIGPLLGAELLVHEMTHNYYHCAGLKAPLCNDRDTALYHSPYVKADRQIDRILVAFHAFANVVLMYRAMLAAGLDQGREEAVAAIAYNLPILSRFGEWLGRSRGLTEAGCALFKPLRDELFPSFPHSSRHYAIPATAEPAGWDENRD